MHMHTIHGSDMVEQTNINGTIKCFLMCVSQLDANAHMMYNNNASIMHNNITTIKNIAQIRYKDGVLAV